MDDHLEQDALIEEALKTYPLASMPRDITSSVMARIKKDRRPALVTWNDFALSLVVALCAGALLFAAQSLPPIMLAKLRIQGILLCQHIQVNVRWLVPTVMFGLAAFISMLAILYLTQMTTSHRR